MNSFNHYGLGSIGDWLYGSVGGLATDPAAPGFRRIVVRPDAGRHARRREPRPSRPTTATARSSWRRDDGAAAARRDGPRQHRRRGARAARGRRARPRGRRGRLAARGRRDSSAANPTRSSTRSAPGSYRFVVADGTGGPGEPGGPGQTRWARQTGRTGQRRRQNRAADRRRDRAAGADRRVAAPRRVRYRMSEPARVRIAVEQRLRGRWRELRATTVARTCRLEPLDAAGRGTWPPTRHRA